MKYFENIIITKLSTSLRMDNTRTFYSLAIGQTESVGRKSRLADV